jgi:CHASE3 domain sensor protein
MRQSEEMLSGSQSQSERTGTFRRCTAWLFSQEHFHFKLLSGTAAGILVIVLLAGIFLYVTLRNHRQDVLRSHTIQVMRLAGLIENDIASLEASHRAYLMTADPSYLPPFEQQRTAIQHRLDELTSLILDSPKQRKRVIKVQEVVQNWLNTVADPQLKAKESATRAEPAAPPSLGNVLLDQARAILQSIQDEEQIVLNQRMADQEWATQSTQILDFVPKLQRAVVEMEKEKRGYLITGDTNFVEAYKRAVVDFNTYNAYLSILVANSPSEAELLANIRANVERWVTTSATPEMDLKRTARDH